jgi:hypothetical protein
MVTFPILEVTDFSSRRLKHLWPTPCDTKDPKSLFDHLLSSNNAYAPLTIAGKAVAGDYIALGESDLNHVFCTCDGSIVDGFQRLSSNGLDLIVFYQYKWTERGATKLGNGDVQEYEKVSICMSTFNPRPLWLLAIITNREFTGDSSNMQCNCVVVPASYKHESFLAPLARTLESRPGKEKKAAGQTSKQRSKKTAQSASPAKVNKKKTSTEPRIFISAATAAPSQSSPTNPPHMMASSSMSPDASSSIHFKPSSTQTKHAAPPGSNSSEADFDPPLQRGPNELSRTLLLLYIP